MRSFSAAMSSQSFVSQSFVSRRFVSSPTGSPPFVSTSSVSTSTGRCCRVSSPGAWRPGAWCSGASDSILGRPGTWAGCYRSSACRQRRNVVRRFSDGWSRTCGDTSASALQVRSSDRKAVASGGEAPGGGRCVALSGLPGRTGRLHTRRAVHTTDRRPTVVGPPRWPPCGGRPRRRPRRRPGRRSP